MLLPYYIDAIGNYQSGFIPSKSTIDSIFILRHVNEKYREYDKQVWHFFMDFAQAYDSVHRDSLWNILRCFMVPEKLISTLRACYRDTKGRVRVHGDLIEDFSITAGLKQGCPMSCLLFNFVLECVMRETPPENDCITFTNGTTCDRLAYADDVDLLGEGYVRRDTQMSTFQAAGTRAGLGVKEAKTKAMLAGRTARDVYYLDVGGMILEVVDAFKYLGSTETTENDMTHEIKLRIGAASKCSWSLNTILRSMMGTYRTKLNIYTSIIRPIVTYAC